MNSWTGPTPDGRARSDPDGSGRGWRLAPSPATDAHTALFRMPGDDPDPVSSGIVPRLLTADAETVAARMEAIADRAELSAPPTLSAASAIARRAPDPSTARIDEALDRAVDFPDILYLALAIAAGPAAADAAVVDADASPGP